MSGSHKSHTRLRAQRDGTTQEREDDTLRTNLRDVSDAVPPAVDALIEAGERFAEAVQRAKEKRAATRR